MRDSSILEPLSEDEHEVEEDNGRRKTSTIEQENQQNDLEIDTQNETPESSHGRPSLQGARNSLNRTSKAGLSRTSFGTAKKSLGSTQDSSILEPLSDDEHESEKDNGRRKTSTIEQKNQQDDLEMHTQNETPESSHGRLPLQGARNSLTYTSKAGLSRTSFETAKKSLGSARDSLILEPLSEDEHKVEEDNGRRKTSTIELENQQDDLEMDTQNETPESSHGRPSLQGAGNSLNRTSKVRMSRASFETARESLGSLWDSLILKPLSKNEHESEKDNGPRKAPTKVRFAEYPEYIESNYAETDPFIYFAGFESPNSVKSLFQSKMTKSSDHKIFVTKDALLSALSQEPIRLINVTSQSKSLGRIRSDEAAMQSKTPDTNHSVDAALRTKTSEPTVSVNATSRSKIRNSVRTFNHTKRSMSLVPIQPIITKSQFNTSDSTVSAKSHTQSKISNSNVLTEATTWSRISDPAVSDMKTTQSNISDPAVSAKTNSQFMVSDLIVATNDITRSRISEPIVKNKHIPTHNVEVNGKSVDFTSQAKVKQSSTYMSANAVMQPEFYQEIKTIACNASQEIVTAGLSQTFRHSGLYDIRKEWSSDSESNFSAESTGNRGIDAQIGNSEIESVSEQECDNEADKLAFYRVEADLNRNTIVENDHGRIVYVIPYNREHRFEENQNEKEPGSKKSQFNQEQRPIETPNKKFRLPEETPDNRKYRPRDDAFAEHPDREPRQFYSRIPRLSKMSLRSQSKSTSQARNIQSSPWMKSRIPIWNKSTKNKGLISPAGSQTSIRRSQTPDRSSIPLPTLNSVASAALKEAQNSYLLNYFEKSRLKAMLTHVNRYSNPKYTYAHKQHQQQNPPNQSFKQDIPLL